MRERFQFHFGPNNAMRMLAAAECGDVPLTTVFRQTEARINAAWMDGAALWGACAHNPVHAVIC